MKKLLILTLVLCLASAASAAHSLGGATTISNTGDTTAVVTISADTTNTTTSIVEDSEGAAVGGVSGVSTIASVVKTAAAGEQGLVAAVNLYGLLDYAFLVEAKDTSEPFDSVATGVQFNVNLDRAGLGLAVDDTFVIYLYDEGYNSTFASHTVTVTPEPMTIALLGLGGLFLRRRK